MIILNFFLLSSLETIYIAADSSRVIGICAKCPANEPQYYFRSFFEIEKNFLYKPFLLIVIYFNYLKDKTLQLHLNHNFCIDKLNLKYPFDLQLPPKPTEALES